MPYLSKKLLSYLIILFPLGLLAGNNGTSQKKPSNNKKQHEKKKRKQKKQIDTDMAFLDILIKKEQSAAKKLEQKKQTILNNCLNAIKKSNLHEASINLLNDIINETQPNNFKKLNIAINTINNGTENIKKIFEPIFSNYFHYEKSQLIFAKIKKIAEKHPECGDISAMSSTNFRLNLPTDSHFASMIRLFFPSFATKNNFDSQKLLSNKNFRKIMHSAKEAGISDDYLDLCLNMAEQYNEMNASNNDEQKIEEILTAQISNLGKLPNDVFCQNLLEKYIFDQVNQTTGKRNLWVDEKLTDTQFKDFLKDKEAYIRSLESIIQHLKKLEKSLKELSSKPEKIKIKNQKNKPKAMPQKIAPSAPQQKKNDVDLKQKESISPTTSVTREINISEPKASCSKNKYFYNERVIRWFNNPKQAVLDSKKLYHNSLTDNKVIAFHAFWPIVDNFIHFGIKIHKDAQTSLWSIPGRIVFNDKTSLEGIFEYVYSKTNNNNLCIHRWFRPKDFIRNNFQKEVIEETLSGCKNLRKKIENKTKTSNSKTEIMTDDYKIVSIKDMYTHITRKNKCNLGITSIALYNSKYIPTSIQ